MSSTKRNTLLDGAQPSDYTDQVAAQYKVSDDEKALVARILGIKSDDKAATKSILFKGNVAVMLDRYFPGRGEAVDFCTNAILKYLEMSGAVLHADGRLVTAQIAVGETILEGTKD